jgi:dephospho-CoA kinase
VTQSQGRILLGLTGNIATGKSEVARMLADLGAHVIDADRVAHQVMQPGGAALDAIVQSFGRGILAQDGTIDRSVLGAIVFRDSAALRQLESAVHPATIEKVNRQIAESEKRVVVVEAIKLIESGMHRSYDALWVVTAPRALQIARLMTHRGLSEEEAILRVDAQPPQAEKAALADLVIENDGDLTALQDKVRAAWATLPSRPFSDPAPQKSRAGQGSAKGALAIRPVRRDDMDDAGGLANVLNQVIAERRHTALSGHWTPEAELAFLQSLSPRSEILVAEIQGRIVGFQVIEPFASYTSTMDHVAILGSYVLAGFRDRGIGHKLFEGTREFAMSQGYEKVVIYVLAGNEPGLAFYRSLGFEERGVLRRQTKIDGVYHDEILMELHFGGLKND